MDKGDTGLYFRFFNEIGIIEQLGRSIFEARLPKGFLVSHFSALNHLIRVRDGGTPLQLARAFQVPKTTMTHTLSVLQRHALVELRPNPKDARSKCVFITDKGRAFRDEAIGALEADLEALRERIPPEAIAGLVPALENIRRVLDENRSG